MISAVVPVLNEEESLRELHKRLTNSLATLDKQYEIIFIDDGSTDGSLAILKSFAKTDKHVSVYAFRKNQGKAEALTFGFQKAKGDYIVTLDADLQDRPEEIERLVKKAKNGFDLVSGWRKNRRDKSKMVLASKLFNRLAGVAWGTKLHDYNCGLKVYTKEAAKSLFLYGGMHRFIPLLLQQEGFTITEEVVEHDPRKFGSSKYGFSKLWKDLPDMFTIFFLTRYQKRPLHFFGVVGGILSIIGILFLSYLTFLHYFQGETVGTRPLWSIGILFTLIGLQIAFTGFLADLITHAMQRRNFTNGYMDEFLKYKSH